MIQSLSATFGVSELCALLETSRSGYYAWRSGGRGKRARSERELTEQIQRAHRRSRGTYGSLRITKELQAQGTTCGHNRVARIMRDCGLKGVQRARFRPRTTDSNHGDPISPNRLKEGIAITGPNQVWVADITYIPTKEGWTYLSAFLDLWSRAVKGWTLRDTLKSNLVSDAFLQAVFRHRPAENLIVHSDRGSQYASREFRGHLAAHKALGSMSRKGNCYDNAAMESFWATLKTEMNLTKPFETKEQARLAIFDYIETFYNRNRLHSSIGYTTPMDFEAQLIPKNTPTQLSANSG